MELTIYHFKKIQSGVGQLVPIENKKDIPFAIQRVFTISGVPERERRGHHAHHATRQVLICLQGSVKVLMDNGYEKQTVTLADSNEGLLIEPYLWHEMFDFENGALLLVLASEFYNEADYIRNYDAFLQFAHATRNEKCLQYRRKR